MRRDTIFLRNILVGMTLDYYTVNNVDFVGDGEFRSLGALLSAMHGGGLLEI